MSNICTRQQKTVSDAEVREVLKKDLGLRFKRIKRVMITANNAKNLWLRCEYARSMILLLGSGKIILNVDETWIGKTDFRNRKWQ